AGLMLVSCLRLALAEHFASAKCKQKEATVKTLLDIGLTNAVMAAGLALLAAGLGRVCKRPAVVHSLWLLVLIKLITPPFLPLPLAWLPATEEPVVRRTTPLPPAPPPVVVAERKPNVDEAPAVVNQAFVMIDGKLVLAELPDNQPGLDGAGGVAQPAPL